ncbi:MAG: ComEC/Rec2 family competence protein [bacterium]|nr:ComEC/Rec2 family competence protein [bacterium]
MLGIACVSFVDAVGESIFYLYIAVFIILFALIIGWSSARARFVCLCLLLFVGGSWRFLIGLPGVTVGDIGHYNGRQLEFEGQVQYILSANTKSVHYVVAVNQLLSGTNTKIIQGKILVMAPAYADYVYGDELRISCLVSAPKLSATSNFRYDRYLARVGVGSVCPNPKIRLVGSDRKSVVGIIARFFTNLRGRVDTQVGQLWPEPAGGLMGGILYGARSNMPADLLDNFNRVGITHVIAISGYNISIIATVLMSVLFRAGLNRRQAFGLIVACILVFILFSGVSASAVRAGIMGVLVLVAGLMGRLSRIGNVLVFTAAVMLLFNPFILIWDAGFQLSFLATLGLVYISPLLAEWPEVVRSTLSAIIATLPLILFQFGRLSMVAPLVNVLILWMVPYLMFFGALAILASFIFFSAGLLFAWIALVGLKFMIFIATWFGSQPWSAVDFTIPWWVMILAYLVLIYWVMRNYKADKIFDDK